ncbi:hypothetical protein [Streptosporangium roseum]|uniref:WxL domain-containing protein n=1 Tax=Streptosporangium roseum (strain ATCC 12428 / DSM 43021 / JCM 3005 / KCTC 9067 / NCIMB 10171 / NRRL 2505 / NI 9100) TaxID=479432 RepID=D2AR83_STRRD|nr:hypothetical protein [Streptosporangium roseum]ACZ88424.1 hypothetical protein Sros_5675 [Streptosporangium roseum DSM 43021]
MSPHRAARLRRPVPAAATALALVLGLGAPAAPVTASTGAPAVIAWRAASLEITVPNTVNIGSGVAGSTLSDTLGTVTVVDARPGVPPWTATVSSTDFTTSGSPVQTITKANVAYWSGPAIVSTGGGTRTAGQPTEAQKVVLTVPRTAFSARKGALTTTTSWVPTLVVTLPSTAAAGFYTGTITHSVA